METGGGGMGGMETGVAEVWYNSGSGVRRGAVRGGRFDAAAGV